MLKLTPDMLRAAYAFLHETEPFCAWGLPDADDLKFVVVRDRKIAGWYKHTEKTIAVSSSCVGHTFTLMRVMAHEMVHVVEDHAGGRCDVMHSKLFFRLAKQVCRLHGFDPVAFV